jgi:hypothetical protein
MYLWFMDLPAWPKYNANFPRSYPIFPKTGKNWAAIFGQKIARAMVVGV